MKAKQVLLLGICAMLLCPTIEAAERWLEGYKKVLVIGAHPDDPETMCGGTMIKLREMECHTKYAEAFTKQVWTE
ncbi:MAG: hypothetical protein IKB46_04925 [Paludibacteraceae bacterium]|nr:hypothetical protein [Paludibacteraceae bacterium]